jgi:ABC-type glycerol-3-phosphate transport system permease component
MAAANALAMIPPFILALIFQRYITQLKLVDPVTVIAQ